MKSGLLKDLRLLKVIISLLSIVVYNRSFSQQKLHFGAGIRYDINSQIYTDLPDSLFMISGKYVEARSYIHAGYSRSLAPNWNLSFNLMYLHKYLPYLAGTKWPNFNHQSPEFTSDSSPIYLTSHSFFLRLGMNKTLFNRVKLAASVGPAFHFNDGQRFYTHSTDKNNAFYSQLSDILKPITWNATFEVNIRLINHLFLETALTTGLGSQTNSLQLNGSSYSQNVYWQNIHAGLAYEIHLSKSRDETIIRTPNTKYRRDTANSNVHRIQFIYGVRDQFVKKHLTTIQDSLYILTGHDPNRSNFGGLGYEYNLPKSLSLNMKLLYLNMANPIIVGKKRANFNIESVHTSSFTSPTLYLKSHAIQIGLGAKKYFWQRRMGIFYETGLTIIWDKPEKNKFYYHKDIMEITQILTNSNKSLTYQAGLGFDVKLYRGIRFLYSYSFNLSNLSNDILYQNKRYEIESYARNGLITLIYELPLN